MKPAALVLLWALPFFCHSQYTYKNLHVDFMENPAIVKNYTYGNLRLYPVYGTDQFRKALPNIGCYTPLQEALQKKKIRISEKNNGASVNDLTVQNLSNDTIIIICGDVVEGGQQDRIVEEDIVLAPKSKRNLKVFCVESGRWSRRDQNVADARISDVTIRNDNGIRANEVVKESKPAEFNEYYSKGAMGLRKVVEKDKDQSKIWSKVSEINVKNKTESPTEAYTAIRNSDSFNMKLNGYLKFFRNKFSNQNIIGLIVVSSNKVLGCDLFATNALFRGQYQSLLHSYATEAILNGSPVTASTTTVKAYADQLFKDETTQQLTLKKKGNSFIHNGKKLRVSSFD